MNDFKRKRVNHIIREINSKVIIEGEIFNARVSTIR